MSTLYVDNTPASYADQLKSECKQLPAYTKSYIKSFFQIIHWLPKYNLIWFYGDIIAALTTAVLIIPQGLAFAKIANLPTAFGLYTCFMGVLLYPLFGTSKDICIGVSAVMSVMIGQIMNKFYASEKYLAGEWTAADASATLSLFSGLVLLLIGVLRLGTLYHFICQPAIAGFMAGSGLTIVINQFSKIFGVPNINTYEAPYLIFGKTLIKLNQSTVDAALGVSALAYLYGVKYLCIYLNRRYPQYSRIIFFFNITRSIVVLVLSTLLCYLINHFGNFEKSPVNIIGQVPAGLNNVSVPAVKPGILGLFASDFPGIIILLFLEHGAIATSLGKTSDYKVDMSQEAFSLGLANVFGSFFCSFPGTGAFARTALMSKSGARTPLTSFFVGAIVLISIYFITPAFTYISMAAFSAVVAHSVTDLIFEPTVWKKFFELNPTEIVIFMCAYLISLFTRIDISVYVPIIISFIVQLYRITRPKYAVLGRLDLELGDLEKEARANDANLLEHTLFFPVNHPTVGHYVHPIDKSILCFQPQENIVFQNSAYLFEKFMQEVEHYTRRGRPPAEKMGDRPWNNTGLSFFSSKNQEKPLLRSVVLDLSGVHQIDYTGIEGLIDAAVQAERYSGQNVHWFIVTGGSSTVRKSLLFAGFGHQRRNAKSSGRFISDLSHPIAHNQHCYLSKEASGAAKFGETITIDKVQHEQSRFQRITSHLPTFLQRHKESDNNKTSSTLDYQSKFDRFSTHNKIIAVHDRFPFFFQSLYEAVQAALCYNSTSNSTPSLENDHTMPVQEKSIYRSDDHSRSNSIITIPA
ncbi:MAG: sulfate transporter family-domain-containing protein [Benjaminiella poitrasii]|nr:MAG: sulfate transporter family-domain-containing protein [Benjaminiella poitrasii]